MRDLSQRLQDEGRRLLTSSLSDIENGKRGVTVDDLAAFAEVFGVEPGWLMMTPREQQKVAESAGMVAVPALLDVLRVGAGLSDEEAEAALHRYLGVSLFGGGRLSATVSKSEEGDRG